MALLAAACAERRAVDCGDLKCASDEFCGWRLRTCGEDPEDEPICRPEPWYGCEGEGTPSCGCNGEIFDTSCLAADAHEDVDINASCGLPDGFFTCGYGYCRRDSQYCEITNRVDGEGPPVRRCVYFPVECGESPSCDCISDYSCEAVECSQNAEQQYEVVCAG